MVTYTTAEIVKKRVKYISALLLNPDIEENINQAESIIDSIMKTTARGGSPDFAFDANKHGIIRNCATDHAAYLCVTYNPSEFPTLADAELVANLLFNSAQNLFEILDDTRTVEYLKGL